MIENIDDAKICADAWRDFDDLDAGFELPLDTYAEARFFRVEVYDAESDMGGSTRAWIDLDITTGKRLLPLIKEALAARLRELGVELPPDGEQ